MTLTLEFTFMANGQAFPLISDYILFLNSLWFPKSQLAGCLAVRYSIYIPRSAEFH